MVCNNSKSLTLQPPRYLSDCLLEITGDIAPEHRNQLWSLVPDPRPKTKGTASWMSLVPDETRITMLNLVATHESLALHGVDRERADSSNYGGMNGTGGYLDNPRCQNRSPYEQLVDGVRYLDCRRPV